MRLDKLLSTLGAATRSESKALLKAGRVQVNGETVRDGGKPVGEGDEVILDGQRLDTRTERHLLLCKPAGVLTAAEDRRQPTVMDLLPPVYRSLNCMPVGRLDKDSEGLILMTSDGDIVNRILRADGRHEKEYEVAVDKPITGEFLRRMREGVPVLGRKTLPAHVTRTGTGSFRIILVQGLNRQIRRMCEYLGYRVVHLKRVRIMNITLGDMEPGHWRPLSEDELDTLMETLSAPNK